jgi:hypothetical protein
VAAVRENGRGNHGVEEQRLIVGDLDLFGPGDLFTGFWAWLLLLVLTGLRRTTGEPGVR